ncbi:hypothetical protein EGP95_04900 [bacterium]|nr:hypothetical protein [bacterium]
MQYIYNYFKDWNLFEKLYLFVGIVVGILTSIIFNGTIIDSLYTITYLTTAILMSKGKVESYFIGIISVFFYGIVSYNQGYYGELLITIFLTFPMMIIGIISWLKHQDKDEDVVIISSLSKKEIVFAFSSQLILFWVYYFLLKAFNTDLLMISSLSIVTSVLATYFEARRSELSLFCYVANDLILITLWMIPIINGVTSLISVLIGPMLLLVNDIYGSYNWKRLKDIQKEKGIE